MRLVLGVFDLGKPYFNFDTTGRFARLGDLRNRGVEVSLVGNPFANLTTVLGAAIYKPRVDLDQSALARGRRPVAIPSGIVRLNVDYRPGAGPLSVDATLTYTGNRPVDVANLIEAPAYLVLDFGARYRFKVGRIPVTGRVFLANATDRFAWRVSTGGSLQLYEGRRVQASLSMDF